MITVSNVSLSFGGQLLFKDVDLKFTNGNCYGIIGANGAGKSTFLKILCGEIEPTTGEVVISKEDRLSVLRQDHFAFDEYTVLETVIMGNKRLYEIMKEKDELYAKEDFTEEDGDRAGQLESEFAELNGWEAESDASKLIQGLGLSEDILYSQMSTLSGNEKVKVLLGQALFGNPDIIMLDEPTNHLDLSTKEVLEDALAEFGGTIILVSHDRYLLNKVASRIIEIKHDEVNSYEGNFDAYSEAVNAARQLKMQSEAEIKRAEEEKAYKENKAKQYRSKEQRAADAQKRNRIRELEKEIEDTEVLIFELENAISDPGIASDYSKMSEKCKELEEAKTALDQKMDEWAELSDQLS